ncbi:MAG: M20/M25/M40 family metallo-hydrolase [Actinobacteria bacterium]|nr:M20/M25/M40 family metallo-hydrolase [Actinomycetota bacterium]
MKWSTASSIPSVYEPRPRGRPARCRSCRAGRFSRVTTPPLLLRLLSAPGPSGQETIPAKIWREAASEFADVSSDTMGNTFARVTGTGGGPRLAVMGHIDEIGLLVSHVDEKGFVAFASLGGYRAQVLLGQRVEILTRNGGRVLGVVQGKQTYTKEQREKTLELEDLHIDIGARDADEARAMLRNGDAAVVSGEPVELPNRRLISRSLDNRLGAYIALEAARTIAAEGGAPGELVAVASVQEEVGLFGAHASAFAIEPDVALAVDVTFATDRPGGDPRRLGEHAFGSGAVLTRGPIVHPGVFDLLEAAAEEEGIPYTLEVATRATNTDADVIHLSRGGVPTGVVSIPLRYMHSPTEMVQLDDVEACIRLVAAFARRLGPGTSFVR